jgi:hypothetical protein
MIQGAIFGLIESRRSKFEYNGLAGELFVDSSVRFQLVLGILLFPLIQVTANTINHWHQQVITNNQSRVYERLIQHEARR